MHLEGQKAEEARSDNKSALGSDPDFPPSCSRVASGEVPSFPRPRFLIRAGQWSLSHCVSGTQQGGTGEARTAERLWFGARDTGPARDALARNTKLGWVRGKQVTVLGSTMPVNVFLGVPYAAPPLGPLRFTHPKPASPWNGIRNATSYPNLCFQNSEWLLSDQHILRVRYPKFQVSEDCLYLNIFAPARANTGSKFPVMVWLPGGAFQTGSASIFDGSALAAYEDMLVVTTQYRLGMFGFFNTGDKHAPGNWAFMDQLAALTWVQENIEFFGGDPTSVTIFGESAGAISVSSLILSPMAHNLFHKAIMQSGVAILPYLKAPEEKRDEDLQMIAKMCGCRAEDSEALLKCLRAKSSRELLSIGQIAKSFTRMVDGFFFPDEPLELLIKKTFHPIPSIIGVNNHECGFLLPLKEFPEILEGSNKSLALQLLHTILRIPPQHIDFVADEYFYEEQSIFEIRDSFLDLLGDVFFVVPGLITAQCHRDSGAPVFFYEFQHRPHCFRDSKPAFVKADHTDEIRFVFGGAFLKGDIVMFGATEEEKLLSRKMMRYWANFARTGNPNGAGLPRWPAYDQYEHYLQLDLNLSVGQGLREQKLEFWTETLPVIMATSGGDPRGPLLSVIFLSLLLPFFASSLHGGGISV